MEEEEDRRVGRGVEKNRGSSSLTVFEQQQTSGSSCTKKQPELILNISVTEGVGACVAHCELLEGFRGWRGGGENKKRGKEKGKGKKKKSFHLTGVPMVCLAGG